METQIASAKPSSAPRNVPIVEGNFQLPATNGRTAVVYSDPEAIADVIKRKMDKDLGDLKPKPANIVQKVLRIIAYPLSVIIGIEYGRTEIRSGTERFLREQGKFDNLKYSFHNNEAGKNKSAWQLGEDVTKEAMYKHEEEISNVISDYLHMPKQEPANIFGKLAYEAERSYKMWNRLSTSHKKEVGFKTAAVLSVGMGIMLTLSDNKNFFSALVKNNGKPEDIAAGQGR